uniref:IF rod domain-containing protein n=1 Tax=Panagrolaimus davidi TaxID=227884 RepID=A0A914Q093_9BILA
MCEEYFLQEKEQLSNLNDRLAAYIGNVRLLEDENARLHVQIKDVEIIEKREKENLVGRYEDKIAELRRLVDALSRDKAKIELEGSGAITKYNDLKQKYDKIDRDFKRVEKERDALQQKVDSLANQLEDAVGKKSLE